MLKKLEKWLADLDFIESDDPGMATILEGVRKEMYNEYLDLLRKESQCPPSP